MMGNLPILPEIIPSASFLCSRQQRFPLRKQSNPGNNEARAYQSMSVRRRKITMKDKLSTQM